MTSQLWTQLVTKQVFSTHTPHPAASPERLRPWTNTHYKNKPLMAQTSSSMQQSSEVSPAPPALVSQTDLQQAKHDDLYKRKVNLVSHNSIASPAALVKSSTDALPPAPHENISFFSSGDSASMTTSDSSIRKEIHTQMANLLFLRPIMGTDVLVISQSLPHFSTVKTPAV